MSALKIFRIISKAKAAIKNRCNILHSSSSPPSKPTSSPPLILRPSLGLCCSFFFVFVLSPLTLCVNMKKCHFIATMRRNFVKIYCAYATLYNKYALKCPRNIWVRM